MGRGISVQRYSQERVFVQGRDAFRLRIVAVDAVLMPTEIFAHQRTLINPHTAAVGDEFSFVCSPFDLTIYPAAAPDLNQLPQFFRKAEIDILVPSQALAEESWDLIQAEVCSLVTALNRLDTLILQDTVRCGDEIVEESSVSAESSLSSSSV